MAEIVMRRTSAGLTPADQHQWEELIGDHIAIGDLCTCTIKKPRNLEFHRLFFAMIRETFEMQDTYETLKQWRAVCIAGAGYCDFVPGRDGQLVAIPKSIAFHRMDETEFHRLKEDVLTFICANYVDDDPASLAAVLEFA